MPHIPKQAATAQCQEASPSRVQYRLLAFLVHFQVSYSRSLQRLELQRDQVFPLMMESPSKAGGPYLIGHWKFHKEMCSNVRRRQFESQSFLVASSYAAEFTSTRIWQDLYRLLRNALIHGGGVLQYEGSALSTPNGFSSIDRHVSGGAFRRRAAKEHLAVTLTKQNTDKFFSKN